MSEQVSTPQRPGTNDPDAWKAYWRVQGWPWRTEPEIDSERQRYLAERRTIVPDIKQGIYPFKDIKLARADVEWLLATHDSGRGPVLWDEEKEKHVLERRAGLDLRGADLSSSNGQNVNLGGLPLAQLLGSIVVFEHTDEQENAAMIKMDGAYCRNTHLEGAELSGITLKNVFLRNAYLQEAHLSGAKLFNVRMSSARFTGAYLNSVRLESSYLPSASFMDAKLSDASFIDVDTSSSRFNRANLNGARLERVDLHNTNFEDATLANTIFKAWFKSL